MQISFHGACQEVTGACTLIQTTCPRQGFGGQKNCNFLVDCGMFQGSQNSQNKNKASFGFNAKKINFVLLTHAHIDHCGRLLKLFQQGFSGKIYSTEATKDLTQIILLDFVKINQRKNQNGQYTNKDVEKVIKSFRPFIYNKKIKITSNINIRMKDAGHILGSSIFEVWIKYLNSTEKKLVFSGDLGNPPAPIIKDPEFIDKADILFIESTYGGRLHEPKEIGKELLKDSIFRTIQNKSTLILPVFALERSQEVLYELNYLVENKIIPQLPIFFDSPLAIDAVKIYRKHKNLYDQEARGLINSGDDIFDFPNLRFTKTRDQSIKINTSIPPKIILASSGMCTGGRIPHHLKRYLENPKNHVLIMSFQAQGTLGRELIEGAKNVIINDQMVDVNCQISQINSYSAHADHNQLLSWIHQIEGLNKIFIMHGEAQENRALAKDIQQIETIIPEYGKKYSI